MLKKGFTAEVVAEAEKRMTEKKIPLWKENYMLKTCRTVKDEWNAEGQQAMPMPMMVSGGGRASPPSAACPQTEVRRSSGLERPNFEPFAHKPPLDMLKAARAKLKPPGRNGRSGGKRGGGMKQGGDIVMLGALTEGIVQDLDLAVAEARHKVRNDHAKKCTVSITVTVEHDEDGDIVTTAYKMRSAAVTKDAVTIAVDPGDPGDAFLRKDNFE